MSRIFEKNFFPPSETLRKSNKEQEQSRELKKKIRNFVLAFMAFVSFGGGVEMGRKLEQAEPKERDKAERVDDRKMPEIEIIIDGVPRQPDQKPAEPKPEELAPAKPRPAAPQIDEHIETEYASRDTASFDQLFDFSRRGKFKNADKVEKSLEDYFFNLYKRNDNLLTGKRETMAELSQYLPAIMKKIAEAGIENKELQEALPILACVEKEKNINTKKKKKKIVKEVNEKGAVGQFQFIKKTAKAYFEVSDDIDWRRDTVEAGFGSYKTLLDNFKRDKDKKVAIAEYNGLANKYASQVRADKNQISYNGYIHYSVGNLNQMKEGVESDRWEIYKARKGDRLIDIARCYQQNGGQADEEKIFEANSIGRNVKLPAGKEIYIPLDHTVRHSDKERVAAFRMRSSGIRQNLEYVAKIEALIRLARLGYFKGTKPEKKFHEVKIFRGERDIKIADLARKHGLSVDKFKKENPQFTKDRIYPAKKKKIKKGERPQLIKQEVKYKIPYGNRLG